MNKQFPKAVKLYEGDDTALFRDIAAIARLPMGCTVIQKQVWLWGFPVSGGGPYEIRQYENPDTWLVWLCTGELRRVKSLIPYPLPWVTFARDKRLRRYKFETLLARL